MREIHTILRHRQLFSKNAVHLLAQGLAYFECYQECVHRLMSDVLGLLFCRSSGFTPQLPAVNVFHDSRNNVTLFLPSLEMNRCNWYLGEHSAFGGSERAPETLYRSYGEEQIVEVTLVP